jgi:hypothetical protein
MPLICVPKPAQLSASPCAAPLWVVLLLIALSVAVRPSFAQRLELREVARYDLPACAPVELSGVFPGGAVALLGRGDTSMLLVTARGASRKPTRCPSALHYLHSTGSDPIVLDTAEMRFATLTEHDTCLHEASNAHLADATLLDVTVCARNVWTLERRQNRLTLRSYHVMDTVSGAWPR